MINPLIKGPVEYHIGRTAEMPDYPDIVPTHPDMSQEELEALIEKHMKEDEELTEWPDV